MDVLRTGVSALGCVLPEEDDHGSGRRARHRRPAARHPWARCCATGITSATNRPAHRGRDGRRLRSADTFCTCCTAASPPASWVRAMHTSLILYAEHEFNASTFTARVIAGTGSDLYSCITGAIGALRGPKHGGANEVAFEIQKRYDTPDEAEADIRARVANKEVIIGFGHPVYTISDPRNQVIKEVARGLSREAGDIEDVRHRRAHRDGDVGAKKMFPEPRLVLRRLLSPDGRARPRCSRRCSSSPAPPAGRAHVIEQRDRRQDHPPERQLHRPENALRTACHREPKRTSNSMSHDIKSAQRPGSGPHSSTIAEYAANFEITSTMPTTPRATA